MADQPLNAMMVEEEKKIALRVETNDGSVKGFVKPEGLKKAMEATAEGGSSWRTLKELIREIQIAAYP
ncbi:glycosyltransferase UGT90A7 [Artemisia annua]|uniref:Glycosyltransferase UGT90A7 n=1 Tax=Artemisia annua TaxID=35608 RepID=A0A2U1P6H2_ARTAN|nr:glycosyltransferase UGT90A7 [Artemisia annua]